MVWEGPHILRSSGEKKCFVSLLILSSGQDDGGQDVYEITKSISVLDS